MKYKNKRSITNQSNKRVIHLDTFLHRIAHERAESTRIEFIHDKNQQIFIELERRGELLQHLEHTVHELKENGATLVVKPVAMPVTY